MSVTDLPKAKLVVCQVPYVNKIFNWRNQQVETVGNILKVNGFVEHNWLIDLNRIFSNMPSGMIIDRTTSVKLPLNYEIPRPWQAPTVEYELDQALELRVSNLVKTTQRLNLFWSGGIDSTTMLTAFLKHAPDLAQLRIFYSPFSTYEHPEYLEFLKKFNQLEMVDFSGLVYSQDVFDGLFLTGDGGDELMASIDQSFFKEHGQKVLNSSWQDFFYKRFSNDQFIDFCTKYFSQAQRSIDSVLEARWFFYAMCKMRFQLSRKLNLFAHYDNFIPDRLIGFFDCNEFENYIYWNLDKIIAGEDYRSWKLPFKQYCLNFDKLENFFYNKQKVNSRQAHEYADKNTILHDRRFIFYLNNGQRISTPNLPFLNQCEFETLYADTLYYLFNEPDKV